MVICKTILFCRTIPKPYKFLFPTHLFLWFNPSQISWNTKKSAENGYTKQTDFKCSTKTIVIFNMQTVLLEIISWCRNKLASAGMTWKV